MEVVDLLNKLKVISEHASAQGKLYVSEFLSTVFECSEEISDELLEYLFKSEFLYKVSEKCISKCLQLIGQVDAVKWLMNVESAFALFDPEKYCDIIFKAYENHLSPEVVADILENSASVEAFTVNIADLFHKDTEAAEENTNRESARNECCECKKHSALLEKLEAFLNVSNRESLNIKMLEEKNRQLNMQNSMLKSVNDSVSREKEDLEEQFKKISEEITARDDYIGDLETRLRALEHDAISLNRQIQEKDVEINSLREELISAEAERQSIQMREDRDAAISAFTIEDPVFSDMEEQTDDDAERLIPISGNYEDFKAKSSFFAKIFAAYYAKKFAKKPLQEQENLLFIKMMELKFDKSMVRQVKDVLSRNVEFSRLDMYNFISSGPTGAELTEYCNSIT